MPGPQRRSPDEIRALLEGSVNSIPTPFLKDGSIDWKGVENIIETGIAGGSRVALLTVGDSRYFFLAESEIAALTRFVVGRVRGRALTVAATGDWATQQAVEFARFCRDAGADVLMSLPPSQAQDAEGLAAHYRALAVVMPVMIVGAPAHAVLNRLLDEPAVCCFKEDGSEAYAIETITKYGGRWKFMTGGTMWRHLSQRPFGCTAFMDWTMSFAPRVGARFLECVRKNDFASATELIRTVEMPMFDFGGSESQFPGGWQGLWRAALELNGIAARYLRPPQSSPSDADMERARALLEKIGILEKR
jgi:dihydrodipicolinate synthase/N-acetylneuraminate lyase